MLSGTAANNAVMLESENIAAAFGFGLRLTFNGRLMVDVDANLCCGGDAFRDLRFDQ
jgi:hypothetical protein